MEEAFELLRLCMEKWPPEKGAHSLMFDQGLPVIQLLLVTPKQYAYWQSFHLDAEDLKLKAADLLARLQPFVEQSLRNRCHQGK